MTARILPLREHPRDCEVCGGEGRVRVSFLRVRGGALRADTVASVEPCPFRSGADVLAFLARGEGAPSPHRPGVA